MNPNVVSIIISLVVIIYSLFSSLLDEPKLIIINVNQGDSALYTYKDFQILFDSGPGDYTVNTLGRYMPFYDKKIEYLVISHFHFDHYGGTYQLLKEFEVENVILPTPLCKDNLFYANLLKEIEKEGSKIVKPHIMKQFWGSVKMYSNSIKECVTSQKEINNSSVISEIIVNDIKIVLMGDLEKDAENTIEIGDVHILKAGHHCSDTSTSQILLDKLTPDVVICSYGKNSFGHPSKTVIQRFWESDIEMFSTYEQGNIVVNLNRKVIYNQGNKIIFKL